MLVFSHVSTPFSRKTVFRMYVWKFLLLFWCYEKIPPFIVAPAWFWCSSTLKICIAEDKEKTRKKLNWYGNQTFVILGNFDLAHLQMIHKFIFEDIYTWAGELRHVNISKGNSFCLFEHIVENANNIFKELKEENFLIDTKSKRETTNRLAYYLNKCYTSFPRRKRKDSKIIHRISCRSGRVWNWFFWYNNSKFRWI